jgi:5-methylcytosine-specific restriction endonuclease McrBC regulatory subunit McrC
MGRLEVRERGHLDLTAEEWAAVSASSGFWRLVDKKVLSVTQPGPGAARRLEAGPYVGRVDCGEYVIEVVEKVDGSVAAMVAFATGRAVKAYEVAAPVTPLGELVRYILRAFLDEVKSYLSAGRDFTYRWRREKGSLIGGRINVQQTVGLRARGLRHLVAFDRNELTRATPTNRVVAAALVEVERIARLVQIPASDLSDARAMSIYFEDCRDAETVFGSRASLAAQAERLRDDGSRHGDLLTFAAILLAHESFENQPVSARRTPRAWFLNLETIFEAAVRRTMASVGKSRTPPVTVTDGRREPERVFTIDDQEAKPDLVVQPAGLDRVVGDVKYKTWDASAVAADLYQLLVHASAFGSHNAFLVFPGDAFEEVELGVAATGAATRLFAVDVRDFPSELSRLLDLVAAPVAVTP